MFGERKDWDGKFVGLDNCPFCILDGGEEKYIIKKTNHWVIRYNKFPYFGLGKYHLLVSPIKHRKYLYELTQKELLDLKNVELFMKDYFTGQDYFQFIRETIGGRSVEHLHYHFLSGVIYNKVLQDGNYLQVATKIIGN